ncbi:MAG: hypothetical protein Q4F38_05260, partial [Akkermansia sp.]|nr:hypothetical protein [Akkermansia sp.]
MKNVACLLLSPLLLSIAGGQDVLPAPAAETAALPAASPRVSVLSYGAIGTEPGAMAPAVFEREMYYLREVGMKVISPAEYLEWSTGKKPLSQNAVLLAFSDVGDGFLTHAVPVLQRCGFAYMVMTEEAGGAAGCTAVTDDASFARAVNFGPVAGEKNVMEDLQACAPAQEAVPQGVALPEFSDDDVAEEVSDEEAAAILPVPDEVPTL